jgi:hypothetical protein
MSEESTETEKQRLDRETMEMLNGLRVIIPGVQVLLAFLLTAPFNQRFLAISPQERAAYFVALISTAIATAFLMAPSNYHRILFRARDKEHLLRVSNALALTGTLFLVAGIVTAVSLVTSVLYDSALTVTVATSGTALFLFLWYGLPLMRRMRATDQA